MRSFIFFNGPPRVGKSTTADLVADEIKSKFYTRVGNVRRINMADHLKIATHGLYGYYNSHPDMFEDIKGEPQDELGGMTWRKGYISTSEELLKKLHGQQFFGDMFKRRVLRETDENDCILVGDSGFGPELIPSINEFGTDNMLLVRLHRDGIDYSGDSRGYVHWDGIESYDSSLDAVPFPIGQENLRPDIQEIRSLDLSGLQSDIVNKVITEYNSIMPKNLHPGFV